MCFLTRQTTSSYVDALAFKHLLFQALDLLFKETLMAFIHTNKTRHTWHLEMTILLALKFITPSTIDLKAFFFFLVVKQCMCKKKKKEKLGNAPKSMHF